MTGVMMVAVIGAGPAGMAAALQLHRFGINTILFEQKSSNSLLKNAWCVENYLGYYQGVSGLKLLQNFRSHLTKIKVEIVKAKVEQLDYDAKTHLFKIITVPKIYYVDYVIVSTGTKPKILLTKPAVTKSIITERLFYEVFPLIKKRNKTILIIGAGDAAFDNALNLAKSNRVIVCNRTNKTNALPLLIKQAMRHRNICYFQEYRLQQIVLAASNKIGVIFANGRKKVYIEADYLLAAIGRLPQKDFYSSRLRFAEKKLVREKKLFLIGDVKNKIYRQVAIGVGDGIRAAMNIFHNLE